MFAIKRIKDGLYYTKYKWVELNKARLFISMNGLRSFMAHNYTNHYLTNGSDVATTGLSSFENGHMRKDIVITNLRQLRFVEIILKEKVKKW